MKRDSYYDKRYKWFKENYTIYTNLYTYNGIEKADYDFQNKVRIISQMYFS